MKLIDPENPNYAAVVVKINAVNDLEGCDNVVGAPLMGFQAIVGKDTTPGMLGIVFPAETQLSEEYARLNNLHRHGNLNDNEGAQGYLEDNRRVKAMKFRGHRSDCLFMPLESLSYIKNLDVSLFSEGDVFDRIGDNLICNKFVVKRKAGEARIEKNKERFVRVEKKFLPEHYTTDSYFRNSHIIPESREVIVTQKLHGTSIRIANTIVARKISLLEQIAKRLGVLVENSGYDYIYGSKRVIKDVHNPNQNHFYSTDIWTEEGSKLDGLLPQGYIAYGELIGWTPEGSPIQKHYTYNIPVGTCDLYIYRIAYINPQGLLTDLSHDQMVEFCRDRGLRTCPVVWRGLYKDFDVNQFIDRRFQEEGYAGVVPLAEESPVDEGVCIRLDGLAPYILKAKGEKFFAHETKMIDEEAQDLEEEENNV